jgi:acyl transferase domain-containing protein
VAPVNFAGARDAVLATGVDLLIEAGPGAGLTALARRHPRVRAGHCRAIALLRSGSTDGDAQRSSTADARQTVVEMAALRGVASPT